MGVQDEENFISDDGFFDGRFSYRLRQFPTGAAIIRRKRVQFDSGGKRTVFRAN